MYYTPQQFAGNQWFPVNNEGRYGFGWASYEDCLKQCRLLNETVSNIAKQYYR